MELMVDIHKNLGRFHLDVSLECGKETLALLGGSGSGKSMTLKCIAGLETPDEGQIVLNGRTLFDSRRRINLSPQARRTGLMLQNYALFPNMTVAENIAICLDPGNRHDRSSRLAGLLRRFQLEDLANAFPGQISGGQQQRVALARIFSMQPDVLMLDEPFSALDSYLKWQLELDLMNVLDGFRQPVLFVSHNRDEVFRISDKIAVMHDGQIESLSSKQDVFARPMTAHTAALTGCKNYSRAFRLSQDRILAMDWGQVLTVSVPVPDQLNGVGIRAHSFHIPEHPDEPNQVPVRIHRVVESPFSTLVIAQCLATPFDQQDCRSDVLEEAYTPQAWLRWEFPVSQTSRKNPPNLDLSPGTALSLAISPEQLLLLA